MTHYDVLGVSATASRDEIRDAYRRAVRRHHPDAGGAASADQLTAINDAWRVLSDAGRRRTYDLMLGAGPRPQAAPRPNPPRPQEPRHNPFARYQNPPRVPWVPMGIVAAVGAVIVVLSSAIGAPEPPRPIGGALLEGECVVIESDGWVVETLCDGAHDGVVAAMATDPLQCPQETEAHPDRGGNGIACVRV